MIQKYELVEDMKNRILKIMDEYDYYRKNFYDAFNPFALQLIEKIPELDDAVDACAINGANDGGMDAIIIDDTSLKIYQFKTSRTADEFKPSHKFNKEGIRDLKDALTHIEGIKNKLPIKLNANVMEKIAEIEEALEKGYSLNLRLVISGRLTESAKRDFEEFKKQCEEKNIVLELYDFEELNKLFFEEFIDKIEPPEKIQLEFKLNAFYYDKEEGIINGQVKTSEIWRIMKQEKGDIRFFGHNYRYFLDTKRNIGSVNRKIEETLMNEKKRAEFHKFNNGIRITCSKISKKDDNVFEIYKPQIVNGGQTSRVISSLDKNILKEVYVDVKVIDTGDNEELVELIAKGTNTQTAVTGWDFWSNDEYQRCLLEKFCQFDPPYWYEIKKGEFETRIKKSPTLREKYREKNSSRYRKIDPNEISKAVLSIKGLPGTARMNIKDFSDETKLYKQIFNIGFSAEEYFVYTKIYKIIEKYISEFKLNYLRVEKNDVQSPDDQKLLEHDFLRFCTNYITAGIGFLFEKHFGSYKIGEKKAKEILSEFNLWENRINRMMEKIISQYSNYCIIYKDMKRHEGKDPEWNVLFKKDETYSESLKKQLEKISKDEIEALFK